MMSTLGSVPLEPGSKGWPGIDAPRVHQREQALHLLDDVEPLFALLFVAGTPAVRDLEETDGECVCV